jgi:hypothetical protein
MLPDVLDDDSISVPPTFAPSDFSFVVPAGRGIDEDAVSAQDETVARLDDLGRRALGVRCRGRKDHQLADQTRALQHNTDEYARLPGGGQPAQSMGHRNAGLQTHLTRPIPNSLSHPDRFSLHLDSTVVTRVDPTEHPHRMGDLRPRH